MRIELMIAESQPAVLPLNYGHHIETHSLTPMMLSLDNRYLSCFSMMDEHVSNKIEISAHDSSFVLALPSRQ